MPRDPLRFHTCGGIGAGKSTLVARLFEGGAAPPAEGNAVGASRSISSGRRTFIVADPPGHAKGLRDLAGAASGAALAVIAIDAREGVTAGTRRDVRLVHLLGVRRLVFVATKMDVAGHASEAFAKVQAAGAKLCAELGMTEAACLAIPTAATDAVTGGDNIARRAAAMPWYDGPTLLEALETIVVPAAEVAPGQAFAPAEIADQFESIVVWFSEAPLLRGRSYLMTIGNGTAHATISPLKYKINLVTGERLAATTLGRDEVGVANLQLDRPIPFDPASRDRDAGRFTLVDQRSVETAGLGMLRFALRRATNVHWQALDVNKAARAALKGQQARLLWYTGLSGAGKSTIANLVDKRLHSLGRHTYLLDGDNVRHGLNRDLGFTATDRVENIRRIAEVARLMVDAGLIVSTAFISPFREERQMARGLLGEGEFIEIFIDTPLAVAETRDPKGLYKKARRGELKNFTGIDSPYDPPENPELRIDTTALTPEAAADVIVAFLHSRGVLDSE